MLTSGSDLTLYKVNHQHSHLWRRLLVQLLGTELLLCLQVLHGYGLLCASPAAPQSHDLAWARLQKPLSSLCNTKAHYNRATPRFHSEHKDVFIDERDVVDTHLSGTRPLSLFLLLLVLEGLPCSSLSCLLCLQELLPASEPPQAGPAWPGCCSSPGAASGSDTSYSRTQV